MKNLIKDKKNDVDFIWVLQDYISKVAGKSSDLHVKKIKKKKNFRDKVIFPTKVVKVKENKRKQAKN